jgi:hypothetical protein
MRVGLFGNITLECVKSGEMNRHSAHNKALSDHSQFFRETLNTILLDSTGSFVKFHKDKDKECLIVG